MQEGFADTKPTGVVGARESKSAAESKQEREAQMKKVFRNIDADNSGSIDTNELADAMRLLGVKCTANSAKKVLKLIDTDGNGTIELDEFLAFFSKVEDPEEIKQMLSACNQKFMDYKTMVENDPNFGKKFHIPPTRSANCKYEGHAETVEAVRWLEGNRFVTASLDGDLKWWEFNQLMPTECKKAIRTVTVDPKGIYCFDLSQDETTALIGTGQLKENLLLWDMQAEGDKVEAKQVFKGMNNPCYACALSYNGKWALSGYKTGTIMLHKIGKEDGEPNWEEKKHDKVVSGVSFCPDNVHFCTVSYDGSCFVFDIADGNRPVHAKTIEDVAATGQAFKCIFRNPNEIITCGDDYCAKRWDLRRLGEGPITNFFGHTSNVTSLSLSAASEKFNKPAGQYLITGASDGCGRVWVIDEMENLQKGIQELKRENKLLANKMKVEEAKDDVDYSAVGVMQMKIDCGAKDIEFLQDAQAERQSMGCVQARTAFEGHKLSLTCSAWRWISEEHCAVLTTSQDQDIRLFMITAAPCGTSPLDFARLDDKMEAGAARRASVAQKKGSKNSAASK